MWNNGVKVMDFEIFLLWCYNLIEQYSNVLLSAYIYNIK